MQPIGPRALVVRHRAETKPWWLVGVVILVIAAISIPVTVNYLSQPDKKVANTAEPSVELSIFWWGGPDRAIITEKALNLYTARHPKVTFTKNQQAFSGYYDKLTAMAAAGSPPDIFQVDDNGLNELVQKGLVRDLSDAVRDGLIDVSHMPESLADYGVVDGRTLAIAGAENTPGMVYDRTVIKKLGLQEPQIGWSWDQLIRWAADVTFRSGGQTWGTMDPSGDYKAFWLWLRQQGKEFYTGSQLAFTVGDLKQWFTMWQEARKKQATPTADIVHAANGTDVSKQLVVTKQAATSFVWSNQLAEMQKGTQNELAMTAYPGDPKGQWARASLYWSASKTSQHPDLVADVINFLVNDPEAAKILGTERGLPPNLDNRALITPNLTPQMQATVTFENAMGTQFGKAPAVPPKGHTQIRTILTAAAESVQSGKATPQAAAEQFVTQATAALGPAAK